MQLPISNPPSGSSTTDKFAYGIVLVDPVTGASVIPQGLFVGLRAMTTQSYTEANVKNGLQYEANSPLISLAAAANSDILFTTGSKPVIIKSRTIAFSGVGISAAVYEAPTITANGTAIAAYNLSRIIPTAAVSTLSSGPTVTATGTQISAKTFAIGSTGVGNSSLGTYAVSGSERVLKPQTSYLLRITNTGPDTCSISAYISWYEGTPDLPVAG